MHAGCAPTTTAAAEVVAVAEAVEDAVALKESIFLEAVDVAVEVMEEVEV